jgi:hypothetical protein
MIRHVTSSFALCLIVAFACSDPVQVRQLGPGSQSLQLAPDQATFVTIDFPGGLGAVGYGIAPNPPVRIVGDYADANGEHGFLLTNGQYIALNVPGATETETHGINDNGDIVGDYYVGKAEHGLLLQGGAYSTVDFPDAAATVAEGINDVGDIVGHYTTGNGNSVHGFLLRSGVYTSIDFPGSIATEVWRVNNTGQIYGRFKSPVDGKFHMFVSQDGAFTQLPDFPGAMETVSSKTEVSFGGLNDEGDVTGDYGGTPSLKECCRTPASNPGFFGNSNADWHGFDLSAGVFTSIVVPFAAANSAFGIDNAGNIVGATLDSTGRVGGYLRLVGQ